MRRIWKFWFYLSLCENAMGSKHKLNNQHMHFHSLIHTLAGLNENLRLSIQFQELHMYCTSTDIGALPNTGTFAAKPQSPNEVIHLMTSKPQKNHIDRSRSIMVAKCQTLCSNFKRKFPSKTASWTLRAGVATKSDCRILGVCWRFAPHVCTI